MIIESVHIKNYRQFVDENIVFAKPDDQTNCTIITGSNGSGKSNLLDAIIWCLYGSEKQRHKIDLPILNISTLKHLQENENAQVCVKIIIIDNNFNRYIIKRSLKVCKLSNEQIKVVPYSTFSHVDGSNLEILLQDGIKIKTIKDHNHFFDHLIPEELTNVFFIDENQLMNYFKDKYETKIFEYALSVLTSKEDQNTFVTKVEKQTKNIFFELMMWKKEYYIDVKIDDKYNLLVLCKSGFISLNSLPLSDKQILTLSFMIALNDVYGFHVPIIIDDPFGRMSNDLKDNFLNKLSGNLINEQIILLVNENDGVQHIQDLLYGKIGKIYEIFMDERQGTSKMVPHT